MNNTKKRALAEILFMEGKSGKEIAELLNSTQNTISKWRKDGAWDEARDFLKNAPHRIEKKLLEELERLADGEQPKINADAVSKIKSAIALLQKEFNPQVVYSVLKKLDTFTATSYPEKAGENTEVHHEFLKFTIEAHG